MMMMAANNGDADDNMIDEATATSTTTYTDEQIHDGDDDDDDILSSTTAATASRRDANIQVFCRIRPTRRASRLLTVEPTSGTINVLLPNTSVDYLQNAREEYEFKFSGVFDASATQEDVFDQIGAKVLRSVLDGYNGTIFAYGQTGSGKTFTITGGAEKYEQRGLIPRTLTALFQAIERDTDVEYTVHISYLEIYNNRGYDLLDPDHDTKQLEQLRKVTLWEDEAGNVRMKNLGMLPVKNEEDALNLLFVGDTNRIICETPMNDASSRSHCIFTINIDAQAVGSSLVRKSKLHLVDLAGSERVKKTNVNGKILQEAQSINLSLHFLQQVIVALHDRSKGRGSHVPYRNSMMTSVLRDSLGGNCLTVMVATMSAEEASLDETVSTCRFAANVAMIKNTAAVNQAVDPQQLIKRLKAERRELREQVAILQGKEVRNVELSDEDRDRCRGLVHAFVKDMSDTATIQLMNPYKLRECLRVMKHMLLTNTNNSSDGGGSGGGGGGGGSGGGEFRDEVRKLRLMVQARDNEINILVSMLQQQGKTVDLEHIRQQQQQQQQQQPGRSLLADSVVVSSEAIVMDRTQAFDEFRRSYRKYAIIEEQKASLKDKYVEAKALGEAVNASRSRINQLKSAIERHRLERGLRSLVPGDDGDDDDGLNEPDQEDIRLRQEIDAEKSQYRDNFTRLKQLKGEIEHIQHMLESGRKHLQADFEAWWQRTHQQPNASQSPSLSQQHQQQQHQNMPTNHHHDASLSARRPPQATVAASTAGVTRLSEANVVIPTSSSYQRITPLSEAQVVPSSSSSSSLSSRPTSAAGNRQQTAPAAPPAVPLVTGNSKADADIAAFYKLRQQMLERASSGRQAL